MNLRKIFAFALVAAVIFGTASFAGVTNAALANGVLVKSDASSAVYYHNGGKLYVFPNSKTYFSWYADFSSVMTVSQAELQTYPLGGNVTYRPGTKLIKTTINPKVYVVGANATIHAIPSEADAISLWGSNWAAMVDDVPEAFFTAYTIGSEKTAGMYGEGQLVKHASSADVYLYNDGKYRRVTETGFNANRFNFGYVATAPASLTFTPMGTEVTAAESGLMNVAGSATTSTSEEFDPNGGTQGSINSIELGSRDESQALEGETDVEIYATDIELTDDGALMITRADVWFAEADAGTESQRPWDYFEEVSLVRNGEVIATADAGSSSDWSSVTDGNVDTAATGREYRLRFADLNLVLGNDATTEVSVAVSMANTIDSADQSADWYVELGSIRILDESGFTTDENTDFGTVQTLEDLFTVGNEEEAAIDVRDANDPVDATVIEVSDSSSTDTNGVAIYNFDVEEQNDIDVNIEEMTLTFTTTGTTTENDVIKRAYLYHGTNKVGEETVANGGIVSFDNMNIDIDGDTKKTLTVKVDLYGNNGAARYVEGTTLAVAVTSIDVFTDANGNDEGDITPSISATSETHELRSQGIRLAFVSSSAVKTFVADEAGESDQGTFKITFTATAFGADMRVDKSCVEDQVNAAGQGTEYTITNAGSNATTCLVASSSTDSEDTANVFEVDEDTTRTLTLTVVATASATHFAEVSLTSVNWGTATNDTNANYYTFDLADYKTDALNLIDL